MIDEFRGKYYFLSNFYSAPVTIDGVTYRNNEAAFQAAKLVDIDERKKAFSDLSPNDAKYMGRHCKLRPDWENIKFDVMRDCVHAKFSQNPDLVKKLLATGNEELIEGNTWHDNTYGDCKCPKCQNIKGKNMLGKILMEEREALRKGA